LAAYLYTALFLLGTETQQEFENSLNPYSSFSTSMLPYQIDFYVTW